MSRQLDLTCVQNVQLDEAVLLGKTENVTLAQALSTLVHALHVLAKGIQAGCTVVMRSVCETSNKQTMSDHGN